MNIDSILGIIQIVVSALIIVLVLMQSKGVGLGQTFGGEGNVYQTKRGAEKLVFNATIFLAVVFAGTALARVLI